MPKVSVVILNWNGKNYLRNCLQSLKKVTYSPLEIIVVDNNSSDGSQEYIEKHYPNVHLIKNKKNYGFAKANNIGFKASSGEYVVILNNDTIVTPGFLKACLHDFRDKTQIACVQPQMRLLEKKNLLDGVGAFLTSTGFLYHFGYLKKITHVIYNSKINIFSAKGACMLLRRSVIEKIGLFDDDFFIFFEETDLCFRIWLAGYSVLYEPKSIVYHMGGGDTISSNSYQYERRLYLSLRNMLCSYLKNFGTRNLATIFPVLVFLQVGLAFFYACTLRLRLLLVIIKAFWWNIKNLKKTLKKRFVIQHSIRTISDSMLNKKIIRNPRYIYYYHLLTGSVHAYKE